MNRQQSRMATNEDLAIAFLCFATQTDKEDMKFFLHDYGFQNWNDEENKQRLLDAIELPMSHIQRKIALLHTSLYMSPNKKKIYEEMANRLSTLVNVQRSPILKPVKKDKSFHADTNDWFMPLNLNLNTKGGTQEG